MSHYHVHRPTLDAKIEQCRCGDARRIGASPTPPTVKLNRVEAREKRDVAIRTVEDAGDTEWQRSAYALGHQIARELPEFTSDEFWRRGLSKPREPRALGPVLLSLQRARVIESTDRLVNTAQVLRNAAPVRVWRSRTVR